MTHQQKELEGKVAWVHGAAGAVGLAVSQELVKAGAYVVLSGRSAEALEAAAAQAGGAGLAEALVVDIGNSDSVYEAAAALEQRLGHIDILVNSAGVNPSKRNFRDLSVEDWKNTVDVNLSGMFYTCQAAMRGMRERKDGVIINISSWTGRFAAYFAGPAYASTKRADLALTESINWEECVNGIRATSIAPGGIDTPLLNKRPIPPSAEVRAALLKPQDVADMVRYIAGLPPRVCINEILMSPTLNGNYLGEFETRKRPAKN
jgi:NADP-dependent 3-hydroxy acid dehydrogenase YdfG